ncbi:MAG: amidohydrolase [candidate division KSB1 bacterium]|nr:amidohydrolase [candidate division KSB1 bacterium]
MKKHFMKDPWLISLSVLFLTLAGRFGATIVHAQQKSTRSLLQQIDRLARQVEPKVIAWRRDLHQHPELSNREFRTAEVVADHLRHLGLEVKTQIAHTGVVGVLSGRKKGPVVALRADMDALPVTEATGLPFASTVKAIYNGAEVGVMHACGHDAHTAMLMGVAEILTACRDRLPGTIKFIFQPAEEGAPEGETGGAELMIAEGVLENPAVDAILGLHVFPFTTGTITYRSGAAMAAVDALRIIVHGQQTHGAMPWGGVDPIVVASQIVLGLQQIISRQVNITDAPAIISIGSIHGGVRGNIIPEQVELVGTIRTLDAEMRKDIHERIRRTAALIAQSSGATAEVEIQEGYPVMVNDPELTQRMIPVLQQVVGENHVTVVPPKGTAEDFAYYQQRVPGLFFFLGVTPPGTDPSKVAMNHSPYFFVDESAMIIGMRCLAYLAVAYLYQPLK